MTQKCYKIPYLTRTEALADVKYIQSQQKHFTKYRSACAKNGKKLRPYECPTCGKWHITSQSKRKY